MVEKFFTNLIQSLKTNPSQGAYILQQAEEAFTRAGYRDKVSGVENILIVRLDVIGDMILTSGFLRELRANFPQARITLVVSPLVYPIVEMCPYVNEILTFDIKTLNRNLPTMFERLVEFCKNNLWRKHFSLAFSPQWGSDNLPGLLMMWLSGAMERIGYGTNPYASWGFKPSEKDTAIDNFLLTKNIFTPCEAVAEVEKCFYLLQAVGLEVKQDNLELFFGAEDFLKAQELLKIIPPTVKKVLLGIGAGFGSRQYPVEKLLIALKYLAQKNLVFVIVGGRAELDASNFIEQNMPQGKVLNLTGKTTLRETEAVIAQMDYYIGNDSGVMHMAAAAQVPVLVMYREAQDKEDYTPASLANIDALSRGRQKRLSCAPIISLTTARHVRRFMAGVITARRIALRKSRRKKLLTALRCWRNFDVHRYPLPLGRRKFFCRPRRCYRTRQNCGRRADYKFR